MNTSSAISLETMRPKVFRALYNPNYRAFWIGSLLSNIGTWMQTVAQGWLVLQLTNSAFLLGVVGFTGMVPVLVFSLVGGVYADRFDRRHLLVATQTALMLLAFILGLLVSTGVVTVGHVLALSLLSGIASALSMPAYQAMVQDLVGRDDLMNAIALNSVQFNLSRVIGPAAAGVALGKIGVAGCFYVNAISFLAVILALLRIEFPHQGQAPPAAGSVWESVIEGMQYVWANRVILHLLSVVAAMSLWGLPYVTLLPIFARDILHRGATELGYLMSSSGVGAVMGALLLARLGDFSFKGRMVLAGGMMFALSVFAFALSKNYHLSLMFLLLAGWSLVSCVAVINTLIQKLVPSHVRGRVMSMYALAFLGLMPIGNLIAGTLAHFVGAPAALAVGGLLIGCVVFSIGIRRPDIAHLR
jgi:MFS family permease